MKRILLILTIFIPLQANAMFSAFEIVKPGTKLEKDFQFSVTHSKNLETCKMEFLPVGYDSKHAWLVVSKRPLNEKEQELRAFVWGTSAKPEFVELITKLSPMNTKQITEENYKEARYKISIESELAKRTYVYIDFQGMVFDGGYYYSIPLGNYCDSSE